MHPLHEALLKLQYGPILRKTVADPFLHQRDSNNGCLKRPSFNFVITVTHGNAILSSIFWNVDDISSWGNSLAHKLENETVKQLALLSVLFWPQEANIKTVTEKLTLPIEYSSKTSRYNTFALPITLLKGIHKLLVYFWWVKDHSINLLWMPTTNTAWLPHPLYFNN